MNVLYLHGFASGPNGTKASALRGRLESQGAVFLAPDLNAPDFAGLTVSRSLARVEEMTREGTWDVVGSSLGGLTAAFFAARFAPRVRRVVLLCPAFHLERLFAASLGDEAIERWKAQGTHPFADASGQVVPVCWRLFEDLASYAGFPPVHHPTLVIHGTRDDTVPVDFSRAFARTSPLVRLEEIDDDHRMEASVAHVCARVASFLMEE